jgi:Anti-anti-sigma regulatory factor (antagonist of anti-sigma factor)
MFTITKEEKNHIMVEVHGKVDEADYKKLYPLLEHLVEKFGNISGVVKLSAIESMTSSAMFEEIKLCHKFRKNVKRWALVDPKPFLKQLIEIASSLTHAEVKIFDKGEEEKAWKWIQGA